MEHLHAISIKAVKVKRNEDSSVNKPIRSIVWPNSAVSLIAFWQLVNKPIRSAARPDSAADLIGLADAFKMSSHEPSTMNYYGTLIYLCICSESSQRGFCFIYSIIIGVTISALSHSG